MTADLMTFGFAHAPTGEGRRPALKPLTMGAAVPSAAQAPNEADQWRALAMWQADAIRNLRILNAEQANTIVRLRRTLTRPTTPEGKLRCSRCHSWLEPAEFVADRSVARGRRAYCRKCDAAIWQERKARKP